MANLETLGTLVGTDIKKVNDKIILHATDNNNPHAVTKAQIGLSNVDNVADINKNVYSSTKLTTARNISLNGDIVGSALFDGSENVIINTTINDDSHNHVISNIDGLQTSLDGKLAINGKAVDSDKLDGLNSTQFLRGDISDTLSGNLTVTGNISSNGAIIWNSSETETEISKSSPIGLKGQINYINQNGVRNTQLDWILKEGNFATTESDLVKSFTGGVSNKDIFNTWNRFSHNNTENQPASASELDAWSYDENNDTISSTVNSSTYIGFYSDKKVDQFILDSKLTSDIADNDRMGIVIAFTTDSDGKEHTLSALRDNEGFTWRIVYNYLRSDAWVVQDKSDIITKGSNWNGYSLGTRIKINRTNDIITAITTQNNSGDFVSASELSINLTSDPRLEIFRGPQSYGYSCMSQENSTFSDIKFTEFGANASDSYIFDLINDKVYIPNGDGSFVIDNTKTLSSEIGPGKLLRDKNSGRILYSTPSNSVLDINSDTAKSLEKPITISLSGDIVGSALFDGSNDLTLSTTITDDSHNHVISNIDGLQTSLDGKLAINGKAVDSDKLDGYDSSNFLLKTGGIMSSNIQFNTTGNGLSWAMNTDGAYVKFFNASDSDTNSRLEFSVSDNGNEYFRWMNAGVEKMTLKGSNLTVVGDIVANSDKTLKENIEIIPDAIEKVKKLNGVTFTRNDLEDKKKRYTGVIAQEVEEVLPEAVSINENGIRSVAYGNTVGLLIEAIKEQSQQIEMLQLEIEKIKNK